MLLAARPAQLAAANVQVMAQAVKPCCVARLRQPVAAAAASMERLALTAAAKACLAVSSRPWPGRERLQRLAMHCCLWTWCAAAAGCVLLLMV